MILDRFVGHIDPSLMREHLQAARGEAIRCGRAVPVVAAACALPVYQIRVDVMGFDWSLQSNDSSSRDKSQIGPHATLPALGGTGARSKRREAAGGAKSMV